MKYRNITTSTLVKTGYGTINAVIVNSHTAGTLKLWDSLSATGAVIINTYTFPAGSSVIDLEEINFNTGLYATIGGTADITLIFD